MRAYKYLKKICTAKESRMCEIADILFAMGAHARFQNYEGGSNIIVDFNQQYHKIIMAHYDIADTTSDGANDNTASVVELLELTHRLIENDYQGDLTIAFLDKEESIINGFDEMGSSYLAKDILRKEIKPDLSIVLDVCGIGDTIILSENDRHEPYETYLRNVCKFPITTLPTPPSDNVALAHHGIPSTLVTVLPRDELQGLCPTWERLHTEDDDVQSINWQTMEMMVKYLGDIVEEKS